MRKTTLTTVMNIPSDILPFNSERSHPGPFIENLSLTNVYVDIGHPEPIVLRPGVTFEIPQYYIGSVSAYTIGDSAEVKITEGLIFDLSPPCPPKK